jgi:hypothetical protein
MVGGPDVLAAVSGDFDHDGASDIAVCKGARTLAALHGSP